MKLLKLAFFILLASSASISCTEDQQNLTPNSTKSNEVQKTIKSQESLFDCIDTTEMKKNVLNYYAENYPGIPDITLDEFNQKLKTIRNEDTLKFNGAYETYYNIIQTKTSNIVDHFREKKGGDVTNLLDSLENGLEGVKNDIINDPNLSNKEKENLVASLNALFEFFPIVENWVDKVIECYDINRDVAPQGFFGDLWDKATDVVVTVVKGFVQGFIYGLAILQNPGNAVWFGAGKAFLDLGILIYEWIQE